MAMTGRALAARRRLAGADRGAFQAVLAHRSPARTKIARMISALAEPEVAYPILLLAGIAAARRDGWRDGRTPSGWWHACAPVLVVAAGAQARKEVSRAIHRS